MVVRLWVWRISLLVVAKLLIVQCLLGDQQNKVLADIKLTVY